MFKELTKLLRVSLDLFLQNMNQRKNINNSISYNAQMLSKGLFGDIFDWFQIIKTDMFSKFLT